MNVALWVEKYSPDQPRAPKGSPEGGRWTAWKDRWTRVGGPKETMSKWLKSEVPVAILGGLFASAILPAWGPMGVIAWAALGEALHKIVEANHARDLPHAVRLLKGKVVRLMKARTGELRAIQTRINVTGMQGRINRLRKTEDAILGMLKALYDALDKYVEKYSPDQPRAPKGTSEGGRWVSRGFVGEELVGETVSDAELIKMLQDANKTNREHAYLRDDGKIIAYISGGPDYVDFDPSHGKIFNDPHRSVEVWHNHPVPSKGYNNPPSASDIYLGVFPGVKRVYSIGRDGVAHWAERGPNFGSTFKVGLRLNRALDELSGGGSVSEVPNPEVIKVLVNEGLINAGSFKDA